MTAKSKNKTSWGRRREEDASSKLLAARPETIGRMLWALSTFCGQNLVSVEYSGQHLYYILAAVTYTSYSMMFTYGSYWSSGPTETH